MSSTTSNPLAGQSLTDRVSDTVDQTRSKLTEFGSNAADKFEENRVAAASGLHDAAQSLHRRAEQLPGGPKVTSFAHSAADKLNATADFVREHDLDRMRDDVEALVKKNPGPALLAAIAVGFLLARAFTGSRR